MTTEFICHLTALSLVKFEGEEHLKYLQGQVTCDVIQANDEQAIRGAHCDFKGKSWNVFQLVKNEQHVYMFSHHSGMAASLPELKKYAVFSKVDISEPLTDLVLLAGAGEMFEDKIRKHFGAAPSEHMASIQNDNEFVIAYSAPFKRYVLAVSKEQAKTWMDELKALQTSQDLWQSLDIQAGCPSISHEATANQFVPQMLNLQAIEGISFEKGCYMGQEVVARTKFLGKNKRATYLLKAQDNLAEVGASLEKQVGENWRSAGTLLNIVSYNDESWALAVLPNDTQSGDIIRSKAHPDQTFHVQDMPYSLD